MGRGASKIGGGSGGGKFTSAEQFERSLTGFDDPRLTEYTNAYEEASNYNQGLRNNLSQIMNEDGYEAVESAIKTEEKMTKADLARMPKEKTPAQLGEEAALKERLDVIEDLKKRKGTKGRGAGDIDIVNERRG